MNFPAAGDGGFKSDAGHQEPKITLVLEQFFAASSEASSEKLDYYYAKLVRELQESRFLVPLLTESLPSSEPKEGVGSENKQVLSVVYVEGPDGRTVAPVFTSVAAMAAWNKRARPVPVEASRAAIALASEGISLMILDPGSNRSVVLRRGSVRALATGENFEVPSRDSRILDAVSEALKPHFQTVVAHAVRSGDPRRQLLGPEVVVYLTLVPGLTSAQLEKVTREISQVLHEDSMLQEKVDGLGLKIMPS